MEKVENIIKLMREAHVIFKDLTEEEKVLLDEEIEKLEKEFGNEK
jgi:hypothetical protein